MEKQTSNHLARVFAHKLEAVMIDKYGGTSFTVAELNEEFLKPLMRLYPNGDIPQSELDFFERFELEDQA